MNIVPERPRALSQRGEDCYNECEALPEDWFDVHYTRLTVFIKGTLFHGCSHLF